MSDKEKGWRTAQVSCRVPVEVHSYLEEVAKLNGISLSAVAAKVLSDFVTRSQEGKG